MHEDKYSIELERAIFDWYYGGKDSTPEAMFNAIKDGLKNDMQVLAAMETPAAMLKNMGDLKSLKVGDTFTADEDIHIKFQHLIVNEQGQYYIPLFTSDSELQKYGSSSQINQSIKVLFDVVDNWGDCLGFIVNPGDKKLILNKNTIQVMQEYQEKSHISFIRGSVLEMHVDAIVNAANTSLLGGGGVDGAIHSAAGRELLAECKTFHGCNTGEAKITGAYDISHVDHIIHTVGPVYSGTNQDAILLSSCYSNALDLALENNCKSIAFSGISTGVYGYPLDEAAEISLRTTVKWLDEHPKDVINIYFCCFKEEEMKAYMKITKGVLS